MQRLSLGDDDAALEGRCMRCQRRVLVDGAPPADVRPTVSALRRKTIASLYRNLAGRCRVAI